MNVRFERNIGHDTDVTRCPLMTQSGSRLCLLNAVASPSVGLDGRGADIDLMAVDHMGDEIVRCLGRGNAEEDRLDEIAVEQHLSGEHLLVLDRLGNDDPTIGDDGEHVGKVVEVDLDTGRIALRDQVQALPKPFRQLSTADAVIARTSLSKRRS